MVKRFSFIISRDENYVHVLRFMNKLDNHFKVLFRKFERFVSPNKLNNHDFAFKHGKMFANTSSRSTTKTSKSEWRIIIALTFPSFRSKLHWVFIVFLIEMITNRLYT